MLEVSLLPLFIVAEEVEAAVAELLACGSLKSEVAGEEDASFRCLLYSTSFGRWRF